VVAVRQRDLRKRNERHRGQQTNNIPLHESLLSLGDPYRACRMHLSCSGVSGKKLGAIESESTQELNVEPAADELRRHCWTGPKQRLLRDSPKRGPVGRFS
jgi:hypothetical protein